MVLLAVISCKSDEEKLRNWYEKEYATIEHLLPTAEECDRHVQAWSNINHEWELIYRPIELRLNESDALIRQGRISQQQRDRDLDIYSRDVNRSVDWIEFKREALWKSTGFTYAGNSYCAGRLWFPAGYVASETPLDDYCRRTFDGVLSEAYLSNPSGYSRWIGRVEYCLERSPRSFHNQ